MNHSQITRRTFRSGTQQANRRARTRTNDRQRAACYERLEDRRVLTAGTLDLAFGVDGFALVAVEAPADWTFGAGKAVAVQADGKVVAGGFIRMTDEHIYEPVIARFNTDGTLDSSFANNGIYRDSAFADQPNAFSDFGRLNDVAIDYQGRILWASQYGFVSRLNADGTLDQSFGYSFAPGRVWTSYRLSQQIKLLPQPDGSIVAAATAHNYFVDATTNDKSFNDIAIFKLTEHGMPDPSFGTNVPNDDDPGSLFVTFGGGITVVNFGVSGIDFNINETVEAIVQTADNQFVVLGNTFGYTTPLTPIAVRFDANGVLDTTFGDDGRFFAFDPFHGATDIEVDSDGRYIVATTGGMRRYFADGTLDVTFGEAGQVNHGARTFTIQSDGKIVTGGGSTIIGTIGRLNSDGSPDLTFNSDDTPGYLDIDFPGTGHDFIQGLAIQPDGKILGVGRHFNPHGDPAPGYAFAVTRVHGDLQPVTLSGRVYHDSNNDGTFEPGAGETGIGGIAVYLSGTNVSGAAIALSTLTATDGVFSFEGLLPGVYTLTIDQPVGFLDGKETAGNLGGTVNNSLDSNAISGIVIGNDGVAATDYLFGNLKPAEISGLVWEDFNNDGQVNFNEKTIGGVTITLTGEDDRGTIVNQVGDTDADGFYMFFELRPGTYTVTQSQPAGYNDGIDTLGTIDGIPSGQIADNDRFSHIALTSGAAAINYNFGERPINGSSVSSGQTASIGFWQNNHGRNLILALNGGANGTQLSAWLAATFPNMYGANAGGNNLTGMTNQQVWQFYNALFRRKQQETIQLGLGGPAKMDVQVFATALSVYVTNLTLAGNAAANYGFQVTEHGLGTATFNVGQNGQAFGVANGSTVSVLDLLLAVNANSRNGLLFDMDGDGDANDSLEISLRTMANTVFSAINEF